MRAFFCNVASAVVIIALAASASLLLAQESTDPERATAVQRQPPTRYQGTISREGRQLGAPARTFGQSAGPEAPSEDPTSAIGITLWCLTIGEPAEPPTDEQVQSIKAEATNQTRDSILQHPGLPMRMHVPFPVTITFGDHDTDFFRLSRQHVINRFPEAQVIQIPESGHFAWLHNLPAFAQALARHFSVSAESSE